MSYSLYDYDIRPMKCGRKDYWDQVRRTINGKPIPSDQITLMENLIKKELALNNNDCVLDLCCGNGRLGVAFFDEISSYVGVDQSKCLIDIANSDFAIAPDFIFINDNVVNYLENEEESYAYTKCLIYGSIQYLTSYEVRKTFEILFTRFINIDRVFISPIPDRSKGETFFHNDSSPNLDDNTAATGRWINRQDFKQTLESIGFLCELKDLPSDHYQYETRFSAVITRRNLKN